MKNIIETKLIEYGKSTYLIERAAFNESHQYISIEQIVHSQDHTTPTVSRVSIRPEALPDILTVLLQYHEKMGLGNLKEEIEAREGELAKAYLKGMELKTLASQYGLDIEDVKQILHKRQIAVVDKQGYVSPRRFWRKKSK